MLPRDVLRLDMAFELQQNAIVLYKKFANLDKNVTFTDVVNIYNSLVDSEKRTEPLLMNNSFNYFVFSVTIIKCTFFVTLSQFSKHNI